MLGTHQLDHCANSECLAIFLTPPEYEPLMSFCPCCKQQILDEVNYLDRMLAEAEDDGSSN